MMKEIVMFVALWMYVLHLEDKHVWCVRCIESEKRVKAASWQFNLYIKTCKQ